MPVKFGEINEGDVIELDGGFTCCTAGKRKVFKDYDGSLWFKCSAGAHYLDGQLDYDNTYIGILNVEKKNAV